MTRYRNRRLAAFFASKTAARLFVIVAIFLVLRGIAALWIASPMPLTWVQERLPDGYQIYWSRARIRWIFGLSADMVMLRSSDGSFIELRDVEIDLSWKRLIYGRAGLDLFKVGKALLFIQEHTEETETETIEVIKQIGNIMALSQNFSVENALKPYEDTARKGLGKLPFIRTIQLNNITAVVKGHRFAGFNLAAETEPGYAATVISDESLGLALMVKADCNEKPFIQGSFKSDMESIDGIYNLLPVLKEKASIFERAKDFQGGFHVSFSAYPHSMSVNSLNFSIEEKNLHKVSTIEANGSVYPAADLQGKMDIDTFALSGYKNIEAGIVFELRSSRQQEKVVSDLDNTKKSDNKHLLVISGKGYRAVALSEEKDEPKEPELSWLMNVNSYRPVHYDDNELNGLTVEVTWPDTFVYLSMESEGNRIQAYWEELSRELSIPAFSWNNGEQTVSSDSPVRLSAEEDFQGFKLVEPVMIKTGSGFLSMPKFKISWDEKGISASGKMVSEKADFSIINESLPKTGGHLEVSWTWKGGNALDALIDWKEPAIFLEQFDDLGEIRAESLIVNVKQGAYDLNLKAGRFSGTAFALNGTGNLEGSINVQGALQIISNEDTPVYIAEGSKGELRIAGLPGDYQIAGRLDFEGIPGLNLSGRAVNPSEITLWAHDDSRSISAEVFFVEQDMYGKAGIREIDLKTWIKPFVEVSKGWSGYLSADIEFDRQGENFRILPGGMIKGRVSHPDFNFAELKQDWPESSGAIDASWDWRDGRLEGGTLRWIKPQVIHSISQSSANNTTKKKISVSASIIEADMKDGSFNVQVKSGRAPGMAFGVNVSGKMDGKLDGRLLVVASDKTRTILPVPEGSSLEVFVEGVYQEPSIAGRIQIPEAGAIRVKGTFPGWSTFNGRVFEEAGGFEMSGSVSPQDLSMDLTLNDLKIFQWLSIVSADFKDWNGDVSGKARVLYSPSEFTVSGSVDKLLFSKNDYSIKILKSFGFDVENSEKELSGNKSLKIDAGPANLSIPGGSLEVAVESASGDNKISLTGGVKEMEIARWVNALNPESRLNTSINLEGLLNENGVEYLNGYLELGGLVTNLKSKIDQQIKIENMIIAASGKRAEITQFSARVGDAPVIAEGELSWDYNRNRVKESYYANYSDNNQTEDKSRHIPLVFKPTLTDKHKTGKKSPVKEGKMTYSGNLSIYGSRVKLSSGKIYSGEHDIRLFSSVNPEKVKLTGEVNILSARSTLPTLPPGEGESAEVPEWLEMDVRIKAEEWIRVEHTLFMMEVFGQLDVSSRDGAVGILGKINSRKGWLAFQDRKFNLEKAAVSFDTLDKIDPSLDMLATSNISDYLVTMAVKGRKSAPEPSFTSDPHLEPANVLGLVLTGNKNFSVSGSNGNTSEMIMNVGGMALSGMLQKSLKKSLNLDELGFEKLADGSTRLQAGRYLNRNLFFSFQRESGAVKNDRYELDYRLKSKIHLQMATESKQSGTELGVKYKWSF